MKNTGIYKWKSPSNKLYIGQAIDLKRRKKEFLLNPFKCVYTSENSAIDRARRKYSDFTKWEYEILAYANTKEELNELEIYYINIYNTTDSKLGYNSTKGGDGTLGISWGSKAQIEALKNRRSYEGVNNPNYGKHHSEETKEAIRKSKLGTKQSIETIKKKSRAVNQYSLDGEFIQTWIGASEVMHKLGIDKASIGRVCKGTKNLLVVLNEVIQMKFNALHKYKCDLTVDPYTQAASGKVRLVINAYFDAKPRRADAFVKKVLMA